MQKKTEEAQKYFNLPETETVIQDYGCANGLPGRLYVSQNFVSFKGGSNIISIPFQKIKSIQKVHLASIEIIADKSYTFSAFTNRTEALQILEHLQKNVPTYTKKSEREELLGEDGGEDFSLDMDFGDMLQLTGGVDTGSTKKALQKINEAQQQGNSALNELSRQRDVLNNINDNLDYIEYTLDDNKKNLTSMDGYGGLVK